MLDKQMIDEFARFNSVLASESRIKILTYLLNKPQRVEALASLSELSIANVSKHLQRLLKDGVVKNKRDGNYIIYEIADEDTKAYLDRLFMINYEFYKKRRDHFELLQNPEELRTYTMDDLETLLENDDVVLIDVRPYDEFEYAHIPGAISVPVEELEDKLKNLPKDKPVFAYCRGPHCLLSLEAVQLLEARGHKAIRMKESVLDWTIHERMKNYENRNYIRN